MTISALAVDLEQVDLQVKSSGLSGLSAAPGTRVRIPYSNTSGRGAWEYVYVLNSTAAAWLVGDTVSLDDAAAASFSYACVPTPVAGKSSRVVGAVTQATPIASACWVLAKGVGDVQVDAGVVADDVLFPAAAAGTAGHASKVVAAHSTTVEAPICEALEAIGATTAGVAACRVFCVA